MQYIIISHPSISELKVGKKRRNLGTFLMRINYRAVRETYITGVKCLDENALVLET